MGSLGVFWVPFWFAWAPFDDPSGLKMSFYVISALFLVLLGATFAILSLSLSFLFHVFSMLEFGYNSHNVLAIVKCGEYLHRVFLWICWA